MSVALQDKPSGYAALQANRKVKGGGKKPDRHYVPATDELQELAASLGEAKAACDAAEENRKAACQTIRERFAEFRIQRLMARDYAATVEIETSPKVQIQYQSRWTETDAQNAEQIRAIAGEQFDQLFESVQCIKVTGRAVGEGKLSALAAYLSANGWRFEFTDTVKPRDTFDRDRFPMLGRERAELLENSGIRQVVVVKVC